MYENKFIHLLEINNINKDAYYKKLYLAVVYGIFETICRGMKRKNSKITELTSFRRATDKLIATKIIVSSYVGCVLSDEEYTILCLLLKAYFRSDRVRKTFENNFKEQLLNQQGNTCNICGQTINLQNSHLDHIIPWDYVGDELSDNYQMLCVTCNERKGTDAFYELSMAFVKKTI